MIANVVDGDVGVHNSNHIELELDYTLWPDTRQNRYRLESYFFVPRSLGVCRYTYSPAHFYRALTTYLQFKTPDVTLAELADQSRIATLADSVIAAPNDDDARRELSYELRLTGCIVHARLLERLAPIQAALRRARTAGESASTAARHVRTECTQLIDELERVLASWRALRPIVERDRMPVQLREVYARVDEYVSFRIEAALTSLLRWVDDETVVAARVRGSTVGVSPAAPPSTRSGRAARTTPWNDNVRERMRTHVVAEQGYRSGAGYPRLTTDDPNHEDYVHRQRMLKKFVLSALWLDVSKERPGRAANNLVGAFAAGIAMLLALALTLIHSQWYVINTTGFIVAATVTYILKDRIKDGLKQVFASRLTRWLADYSVSVRDPLTGHQVGHCREAFTYVPHDRVPRDVLSMRGAQPVPHTDGFVAPEVVFKYEKDVVLRSSAERSHVNDIIRFAMSDFLAATDDPVTYRATYDARRDRVRDREYRKVYHLHMVVLLCAQSHPGERLAKRFRIVFDKQGIRRLEALPTS